MSSGREVPTATFNTTVWKLRKFTLTHFDKKIRELKATVTKESTLFFSNVYTEEVTKELISRNIFSVRVNFSFFHTVHTKELGKGWMRGGAVGRTIPHKSC